MSKIAKITMTIQMDEDPEWLDAFVKEQLGEDANPKDNDYIHDAIAEALGDDLAAFFTQIDSVEPFFITVTDEK